MIFTIDIEPTNRCNASCTFCPRGRTPHQGLMSADVFAQALERAKEFRATARSRFVDSDVTITLCGLGEALLNPRTPSFVHMITEAGFSCALSTNASLLDETTGRALLDAGLLRIFVNAGDVGEAYEQTYALPFERTSTNVRRFAAMAKRRCAVFLVVVDHDGDPERVRAVETYWRSVGVKRFQHHDIMNRGGSLSVEGMQFTEHPNIGEARELLRNRGMAPICGVAFRYLFVGYDGQYYLCSSDWEKRVPLGSVFDESFSDVTRGKLEHVETREPICTSCCHDPVNQLAERLRALEQSGNDGPTARGDLLDGIAAADKQVRAVTRATLATPATP